MEEVQNNLKTVEEKTGKNLEVLKIPSSSPSGQVLRSPCLG